MHLYVVVCFLFIEAIGTSTTKALNGCPTINNTLLQSVDYMPDYKRLKMCNPQNGSKWLFQGIKSFHFAYRSHNKFKLQFGVHYTATT